jgi:hypothetical protein
MRVPTANGKPSSGASIGVPANPLQLSRKGRYITLMKRERYLGYAVLTHISLMQKIIHGFNAILYMYMLYQVHMLLSV